MQSLDDLLAETAVFAGLRPETLRLVAGCARNEGFAEGAVIFAEGDPADTFLLVRRGRIAVELHAPGRGPLTVYTVEDGDVVGWSWLFPPYRWRLAARAVEDVRAISFDGACLRGKCDADPALGYELMGRFARLAIDRLEHTQLRLLDVYGTAARV